MQLGVYLIRRVHRPVNSAEDSVFLLKDVGGRPFGLSCALPIFLHMRVTAQEFNDTKKCGPY